MKLESQVVSLELAKQLKELGVKQLESLFVWYDGSEPPTLWSYDRFEERDEVQNGDIFSAFTVAEFTEMFVGQDDLSIRIELASGWAVTCGFGVTGRHTEMADTLADALAKMVLYLIEKNLMEV